MPVQIKSGNLLNALYIYIYIYIYIYSWGYLELVRPCDTAFVHSTELVYGFHS